MDSRNRSILGTLIAVVLIPAIIGLLACLPVPIGNPERSRLDPYFSGMWVGGIEDGFVVANFEPYDKRTWLLTYIEVDRLSGCTGRAAHTEPDSYATLVAMIEKNGRDCYASGDPQLFKVWLSKLGGQRFLTWEPKGLTPVGEGQELELLWWVFREEKLDSDNLNLWPIDAYFEGFENVEETRRAYEKVVKKNAANSEMYFDDPWLFRRVDENHIHLLEGFVSDVISSD